MRTALEKGDRIAGKYRVLRRIGSGGMGAVYLAQHERFERLVAIKVLHHQIEGMGNLIARFEREIKAMSMVKSPYVASALDTEFMDDGSLCLVMEYLEGRDLRSERKLREVIPYREAVAYLIQACLGVADVHDVGIIHRDLKPHNLFLTNLNGARCVKVLDFGVAKFLSGVDLTLTATDVAVGTPLYMSPEQLCSPKDVSPRSDIWALGVVLYELIAGVTPFAAETPGAVVAAVTLEDPVMLDQVNPDVPGELAEIIAGALVKSTAARIGSAREFIELLTPHAMPVDAITVSGASPSQRPAPAIERSSTRPELSEKVRQEVEAFDETRRTGKRTAELDAIRELPSLAPLSIPLTKPALPRLQLQRGTALANEMSDSPLVIAVDSGRPLSSLLSSGASEPMARQLRSLAPKPATRSRRAPILGAMVLLVAGAVGVGTAKWTDYSAPREAAAGHSAAQPSASRPLAEPDAKATAVNLVTSASPSATETPTRAPGKNNGRKAKPKSDSAPVSREVSHTEPPQKATPTAPDLNPLHL
jgi:serine/threonine-protein kinase